MLSELTVIVKNEEKRQTTKHLIYEPYSICGDDSIIQEAILQAVKEFNADPDDIRIKISMEVK
jgi:hypothetical protein